MRWPFRLRWLMVLALLLGQYSALAHEYGGETHDVGTVCQLCLHHHQAKEFLQSAPVNLVLQGIEVAAVASLLINVDVVAFPFYRSRAPPFLV